MNASERLILVDDQDHPVGEASKSDCHDGDGQRHRAFSIFLFDSQGRVLLQERSRHKRLWPRYWSNACCSHPRVGEETQDAALRRLREELGVTTPLTFLYRFEYHAGYCGLGSEHEVCSVFIGRLRPETAIQEDPLEVIASEWVDPNDVDLEIARDASRFTPWFLLEWQALRTQHTAAIEALA